MEDPFHIKFLLDGGISYKTHFLVGNEELGPVKKFGVIKKMLSSHSEVFRASFSYRVKGQTPEHIQDILPSTFKNMLRFVYGHDNTGYMSFEDADDLLYAADKYMMHKLMRRVAARLVNLVNVTNVLTLLSNPACYRVLELRSEMCGILSCNTGDLFSSNSFIEICPEALTRILELECLNMSETKLWRAVLRWAKHRAGPEADAVELRRHLSKPLQQLRLSTLRQETFWSDVVSTGMFSYEEVAAIFQARSTICPHTTQRRVVKNESYERTRENHEDHVVHVQTTLQIQQMIQQVTFSLHNYDQEVQIRKMIFYLTCQEGVRFKYWVKLESAKSRECVTLWNGGVNHQNIMEVLVSTDEREVWLEPNTTYYVTVNCDRKFASWVQLYDTLGPVQTEHIWFVTGCDCPLKTLVYRVRESEANTVKRGVVT